MCSINSQVNGLALLGTMNLNKRRLIFCTFIYSCAAIGLIGAGLGSKRWVVASARRTSNTTESVGQVNLGLFYGDKYLNIGYGLRTYSVDGKQYIPRIVNNNIVNKLFFENTIQIIKCIIESTIYKYLIYDITYIYMLYSLKNKIYWLIVIIITQN